MSLPEERNTTKEQFILTLPYFTEMDLTELLEVIERETISRNIQESFFEKLSLVGDLRKDVGDLRVEVDDLIYQNKLYRDLFNKIKSMINETL